MKTRYFADFSLFLVALMWGLSFIIMKSALDHLDVFNLLGIRFLVAAILSALIFHKRFLKIDFITIKRGIIIGIFLFLGYAFQTLGLHFTSASKSAFITGFNVVLVPVLTPLIIKKIPGISETMAAVIAFIGIGFLSLSGDIHAINIGDVLTLAGAFAFALQIIFIGKFCKDSNNINSAIIQIGFVGILSIVISIFTEGFILPKSLEAWKSILFLSLFCTAFSFIVQNIAQRYTTPARTSLIFTFEPVSAPVFAYFILGEILTPLGILGAILVVTGMLLSELDLYAYVKKQIEFYTHKN